MTEKLYSIEALRRRAHRRLPKMVSDFLDGGALDERTLRANREAFESLRFKQRILRDLSEINVSTSALGEDLGIPMIVSPMGLLTILHPDSDLGIARAVARARSLMVHSPWSGCSLEETHDAAGGRVLAQIAFWRDRKVTEEHIARARNLGVSTLVVAGDVAFSSKRERDIVHGTGMPPKPPIRDVFDVALHPGWMAGWLTGRPMTWGSYRIDDRRIRMREMDGWMSRHNTKDATWEDVAAIRRSWDGRIAVKGVMCVEDAEEAVNAGADAIFISNHGGRQFDNQPGTVDVLPRIADAVGDRAEIIVDGGVRRGSDIVAALGRGANLAAGGRAFAYGLAAAGEAGADRAFAVLSDELRIALAYAGVRSVSELGPHVFADGAGPALPVGTPSEAPPQLFSHAR
ncbi:alpha-hydroxy-acid oxidizing protein [Leucobacter sp. CSA2]|uniref:Alpha-hydroxy-acid oxidizing protein n=1 Tax=Leucobacter edaphi TaxID=2796472 RepID=A0A934QEC4_9MICO|nr:alpha-hydroxy acid oxidase [Leucobacter edaphi]MBK0421722.1 alpha-hydroxy-acid oxidizing protein [Leucobacter edaphi]